MRLLSFLVALIIALPAVAQDYPNKPIRIITAFGAGTATDVAARVIGAEIASQIGQSVVIENKPAEGQIAAQAAAAAAPDGYTLFFTTQTTQAINPHVYKALAYDPVKSFTPIAGITQGPQIVMVRNDLPAKTIDELIVLAKAQPGKLSFGTATVRAVAAPSFSRSWPRSICWAFPTRPSRKPLPICWAAGST